jgi:hypothetical protein
MNTLNKLKFSVLNRLDPLYHQELVSLDLIEDMLINTRSLLIKNDLNKGHSLDSDLIQDLGCLELEEVDTGCCDYPTDCKVLRTKEKLPTFIEIKDKTLLTRVGPVNILLSPYQIINYSRVSYLNNNRFFKKFIKAFLKDNYIYIIIHNSNITGWGLNVINVQGVLEDPRDAYLFNNCENGNCYTEESKFPIKSWMADALIEIVLEKLRKTHLSPTDRNTNNDVKLENK